MRLFISAIALFILVLASGVAPASIAAQQGGTTRYVYDDNGRLRAVVSPTGEAAVYEYDPAGNFTAIRRLAANALELLDFFPKQGVPGDPVTFIGVGFGAGVNSVSFNGASAQVVSSNATTVVATVPQGATTGLVSITTPGGTVTTAVPFTIRGVRVTPASASVVPGGTVQFSVVVAVAGGDQTVTWSVNGINAGNTTVGTISDTGFYTAPIQPGILLVRATSNADVSLIGEAIVTAQYPINVIAASVLVTKGRPQVTGISPNVLARGATTSVTINGVNFTGATSVLFYAADGTLDSTIVTSGMSVTGSSVSLTANLGATSTIGKRVVVVYTPAGSSQLADAGVNTVDVIHPVNVTAASVLVTKGRPQVASISPSTIARGASTPLTINGVNFTGATSVLFYAADGTLDSTITVSGLTVSGGGMSLTLDANVGGATAPGKRIAVVFGPAGSSQLADVSVNTITIVP